MDMPPNDPVSTALLGHTICVVGLSKDPSKESHSVAAYLQANGYRIIPVNPTASELLGEKCYPDLSAIPPDLAKAIDVIDVFRPSADTPLIAAQAAELSKRTGRKFVIWLQLGITNADAQKIAHANDLGFVEDKCLKIEHQKSKQRNGGR